MNKAVASSAVAFLLVTGGATGASAQTQSIPPATGTSGTEKKTASAETQEIPPAARTSGTEEKRDNSGKLGLLGLLGLAGLAGLARKKDNHHDRAADKRTEAGSNP